MTTSTTNFRFRLHSADNSQVLWENIDGANSTAEATEFLRQNSFTSLPGSIERSTDGQQTWEPFWSGTVELEGPTAQARGQED
jgi:predicted secreted hydrolase